MPKDRTVSLLDERSFQDAALSEQAMESRQVVEGNGHQQMMLEVIADSVRRDQQALGKTWQRRPDLLEQVELDQRQQKLLDEFISEFQRTRKR